MGRLGASEEIFNDLLSHWPHLEESELHSVDDEIQAGNLLVGHLGTKYKLSQILQASRREHLPPVSKACTLISCISLARCSCGIA